MLSGRSSLARFTYEVPRDQDLRIDLSRMPTRPARGVVLRNVRPTEALLSPSPAQPSRTAETESKTVAAWDALVQA